MSHDSHIYDDSSMTNTWMSHDTHMNESWHVDRNESLHAHEGVTVHASTCIYGCVGHVYERVTARELTVRELVWSHVCSCALRLSPLSHVLASRQIYERVMTHTYGCVMSHVFMSTSYIWMNHGTHSHTSCYSSEWMAKSEIFTCNVGHIHESRLTHETFASHRSAPHPWRQNTPKNK